MKLTNAAIRFIFDELKKTSIHFSEKSELEPLDERQKKMLDAIIGWSTNHEFNAVVEYANALVNFNNTTGKNFDFFPYLKGRKYSLGMIVTITSPINKYSAGATVCMIDQDRGFTLERGLDNSLPSMDFDGGGIIRLATKDEIETYYSEMIKKDSEYIGVFLKYMFKNIEISIE